MQHLYDRKLAAEIDGELIGDEFKGYIFKIAGGQDKEGFSMKQGVLTNRRVRLLMHKNVQGCRGYGMRSGERKRKSVRGCVVSPAISVLHLVIVKDGDAVIPGFNDSAIPRRLGPKRASKIRKLFNLNKEDDPCKYVIRREIPSKTEGQKPRSKAPKIQRLVTPMVIKRKRRIRAAKIRGVENSRAEAAEYAKVLAKYKEEERLLAKSSHRQSKKETATPASKK